MLKYDSNNQQTYPSFHPVFAEYLLLFHPMFAKYLLLFHPMFAKYLLPYSTSPSSLSRPHPPLGEINSYTHFRGSHVSARTSASWASLTWAVAVSLEICNSRGERDTSCLRTRMNNIEYLVILTKLREARSRLYRRKQASKQVRSVPSKKKEKGPRQTARN